MSPDAVRAAYERVRAEVGSAVTVVVATKYVSLEDMAALAEAGVEVVGENRAQDLERKRRLGAGRDGVVVADDRVPVGRDVADELLVGRGPLEFEPDDQGRAFESVHCVGLRSHQQDRARG